MPDALTAARLPEVNAPRFNIVTKALASAEASDGRKRFKATASSTITDRAGDEITLPALQKMAAAFDAGLTIFMDHNKSVHSAFGTTDKARVVQAGTDPRTGAAVWDLDIEGYVNEPNDRAMQLWRSIEGGYVKFGTSIGAFVLDHSRKPDGGLRIDDIDVFEASIVGVPMNQRSWVKKAVKAIKSFDGELEDDDDEDGTMTKTAAVADEATEVPPIEVIGVEKSTDDDGEVSDEELALASVVETASADAEVVTKGDGDCPGCGHPTNCSCDDCDCGQHGSKSIEAADEAAVEKSVIEGVQETEPVTPETTPAATEGDETDPAPEQKVATVPADDIRELVKRLSAMTEEISRLREENAKLRAEKAAIEQANSEVQSEVEAAKSVIEQVMRAPLRPKTAGYIDSFVERFPQFDPRIAHYLNARGEE